MDTLHAYIRENKVDVVAEFLTTEGSLLAKADSDGRTPLMWALSESKNPSMVKHILEQGRSVKGFDLDAADQSGFTALHIASAIGTELAEPVLAAGPQVDARTNAGQTPLMLAVSKQQRAVVEMLLEHKASPRIRDKLQVTPLMRAAARGDTQIVTLLLEHDAPISATDANGWSAVHYAYAEGQTETLDLLVARGGDLELLSKADERPADVAPLGYKYQPKK